MIDRVVLAGCEENTGGGGGEGGGGRVLTCVRNNNITDLSEVIQNIFEMA